MYINLPLVGPVSEWLQSLTADHGSPSRRSRLPSSIECSHLSSDSSLRVIMKSDAIPKNMLAISCREMEADYE